MARVELSEQKIKTILSRGPTDGQVFVISTRPVPEHPDPVRNILCSSLMVKVGDPIRRFPGAVVPTTPWARLLCQCRQARAYNHELIAEAVAVVRWRGFDALEDV